MNEIVHIQIGQCGNQIGTNFWETISNEHSIDPTGLYNSDIELKQNGINVFYNETSKEQYVPRAVLCDLDPITIDSIRSQSYGKLFHPDNFIVGSGGTGNNWAKGHYTEGAEIIDSIVDVVRKEVERCEKLQGFQITNSLEGGTGSGLGTLLISKLREQYQDRVFESFSVFPSNNNSDILVGPYNSTLAIDILLDSIDMVHVINNESLYRICSQNLKIKNPKYENLNHLVSSVMSGITSSMRFPGQLNTNLRKLATNLTPEIRIHFFIVGYAPLCSRIAYQYKPPTCSDLVKQLLNPNNSMCECDSRYSNNFAFAAMFRGKISSYEIEEQMMKAKCNTSLSNFHDWIPNSFHTSLCDKPPKDYNIDGTFIINSSSIQSIFKTVAEQFTVMFRRKAFLHWFKAEGMDEMEFTQAETHLCDLVSEYWRGCCCCGFDNEEEEDEDNEEENESNNASMEEN